MEIETLAEQIRTRTQELGLLQTLVVQDTLSLREVEYRTMLVEQWDTPLARPSILGASRLELVRLRLGITPERARELVQDVRAALAAEALASIGWRDIAILVSGVAMSPAKGAAQQALDIASDMDLTTSAKRLAGRLLRTIVTKYTGDEEERSKVAENVIQALWRAINFDPTIAAHIVLESLPSGQKLDIVYTAFIGALLTDPLLAMYKISAKHNNYLLFNTFLHTLREGLKARVSNHATITEQQHMLQEQIDQTIDAIRIEMES